MEPLPAHIRPEDEVYFRHLPLTPMSFRARWVLGIKILVAAQLVLLPVSLLLGLFEHIGDRLPSFLTVAGLIACAILVPLWAAGLLRGWVASSMAQRIIDGVLAPPTDDTPKP